VPAIPTLERIPTAQYCARRRPTFEAGDLAERVLRGFAGELEERLAGESVLFERLGGGTHTRPIGATA
jgi:hypothetical protein